MEQAGVPTVVLDTNIVLDLFIFADPATPALRAALEAKSLRWIATQVMRDELELQTQCRGCVGPF